MAAQAAILQRSIDEAKAVEESVAALKLQIARCRLPADEAAAEPEGKMELELEGAATCTPRVPSRGEAAHRAAACVEENASTSAGAGAGTSVGGQHWVAELLSPGSEFVGDILIPGAAMGASLLPPLP